MTAIDLALRHGDTYLGTFAILKDGAAADLTGCTIKAMIKPDFLTPDASATLTLLGGAGLTVIDALAGIVTIKITAVQSALLNPSRTYVWDFQVKETNSDIFTACAGAVQTTHDVVFATS